MPLHDAPRFLICRLSAVGDCVHTLPLVDTIKRRWPTAFIAWAVQKGPAALIESHEAVDETIVVPKRFLRSPREMWRLRKQLRALHIDVALDPQSLTKSAVLGMLSGARRRIGFARPAGREIAPLLHTEHVVPQATHVVDRYRELLRPLDVDLSRFDVRFQLARQPEAEALAERLIHEYCGGQAPVVINPGAGWDSKLWPAERFGAVANYLGERFGYRSLVVWSGERERAWAETIVQTADGQAGIAPPTSLIELTALVRRARLFVGSDTGPLHIAAATGTPCVAVFGPTRAEVCGPYGSRHLVIQSEFENLGSSRKAKGRLSQSMLNVSAQWACGEIQAFLGKQESFKAA